MKKFAIALASVLVLAGLQSVWAADPAKTHDMKVEVVSVDTKAHTVTFKDESGKTQTAKVLEEARASLKDIKAGDKCTITCKDNEKGEHQGVTSIRKTTTTR
jgi:glycine cleavage system protein P-like pyridoxal-binding family